MDNILTHLILFLTAFWGLYVLVMGLYRAHLEGRLKGINLLLAWPYLLLGAAVDLLANLTLASILFLELPRELLVTGRLQRHMRGKPGWRRTLSQYICDHMLDVFDPRGNHC